MINIDNKHINEKYRSSVKIKEFKKLIQQRIWERNNNIHPGDIVKDSGSAINQIRLYVYNKYYEYYYLGSFEHSRVVLTSIDNSTTSFRDPKDIELYKTKKQYEKDMG